VQPAELRAAKLQRARGAGLEKGALALNGGGGKIHNELG
jgi:hypothetical protein